MQPVQTPAKASRCSRPQSVTACHASTAPEHHLVHQQSAHPEHLLDIILLWPVPWQHKILELPAGVAEQGEPPCRLMPAPAKSAESSLAKRTNVVWSQQLESVGEGLLPHWQVRRLAAVEDRSPG